jgi:hypothetical protein
VGGWGGEIVLGLFLLLDLVALRVGSVGGSLIRGRGGGVFIYSGDGDGQVSHAFTCC